MAPLPPVAGVLRVIIGWSDSQDLGVSNTQYWNYSGGAPSASDAQALAAAIYTAATPFANLMNAANALTSVKVIDLSSDTAAEGTHEQVTSGGRDGGDLAGGTCVVISFQIARRYRGGKPRNYFPWGVSEDLLTRQSWTSSFITEVNTRWDAYAAAVIGATGGGTTITSHANVSYYTLPNVVVTSPTTGRARNMSTRRSAPLVNTIVGRVTRVQPGSQRKRN